MDVHGKATVFCLLNAEGEVVDRGSLPTTAPDLTKLIQRLSSIDTLLCGQEVGTMTYFVHDVVTSAGAKILSFNAQHLRMIAASRKKTDRRDAYWIAKSLQTGLMPHAVHIPTTEVRRLRSLLAQRRSLAAERKRWLLRARSHLRAIGTPIAKGAGKITRKLEQLLACPDGLDADRADALELRARQEQQLRAELRKLEKTLYGEARRIDAVRRLRTSPAVGPWVGLALYAWVGDIRRFRNARLLSAYAGLVPSVHQSCESTRLGSITKEGSSTLRSVLVQAGHVLLFRCGSDDARPLRELPQHESVQSHGWTKGEVCLEAQLQVGRPHRQDARQENRRHRHRTKTRRRPLGDVARRHHLRSGGTGQGERKGHSQRGSFEKRECGGARTRRQETPAAGSSPQQDFGGRRHDMNRHDRLRCALSA
jgi:transposase